MSDKMREEFEAWSMKEYPGTLLAKASTGGYRNLYVQMCWLGWQASRESLVIELPSEKPMSHNPEIEAARLAFNDATEECRDRLEAAGLKVKP